MLGTCYQLTKCKMFIQQFLFITAYFFIVLLPDPNFDVLILMHVAGTKTS